MGELILMNLCRPALGVQFFLRHSVEPTWGRARGKMIRQQLKTLKSDYSTRNCDCQLFECHVVILRHRMQLV